jgi:hypothetical protein
MFMKKGVLIICPKTFKLSTIKLFTYFTSLRSCYCFFIVIEASKSVIFRVLAK